MVNKSTRQLNADIPTNATITIYHTTVQTVSGRPVESYIPFVVNCWLETSKGVLVNKYSTESDIQAIAIIPIQDVPYISAKLWEEGYFTVVGGKSRVVIGDVVREITKVSDLTDDDTIETLLATDVEELIIPDGLHHIEVGLK